MADAVEVADSVTGGLGPALGGGVEALDDILGTERLAEECGRLDAVDGCGL